MNKIVLIILIGSFLLLIFFILTLFLRRFMFKKIKNKNNKKYEEFLQLLDKYYSRKTNQKLFRNQMFEQLKKKKDKFVFLEVIMDYFNAVDNNNKDFKYFFYNDLNYLRILEFIKKLLGSKIKWKKTYALNVLIKLNVKGFKNDADKLLGDNNFSVNINAIEYLLLVGDFNNLEIIIRELAKVDDWFLKHFIKYFVIKQNVLYIKLISLFNENKVFEERKCICKILKSFSLDEVDYFFKSIAYESHDDIREIAAEYLFEKDPQFFAEKDFHKDDRPYIRSLVFQTYPIIVFEKKHVFLLLENFYDKYEVVKKSVISSLFNLCKKYPEVISILEDEFLKSEKYDLIIIRVFDLLDINYEYISDMQHEKLKEKAEKILIKAIKIGELSDIFSYLKISNNVDLKNKIVEMILENSSQESLQKNEDLIEKIQEPYKTKLNKNLKKVYKKSTNKSSIKNYRQRISLTLIMLATIILPFFICCYNYRDLIRRNEIVLLIANVILIFNKWIVFYVGSINSIYFLLFIFSIIGIKWYKNKKRAWTSCDFIIRDLIPPITIIAPCYNESATVVESINSLLNLRYPNYEIVVVNDGSKDDTLSKLIDYYELDKTALIYRELIKTSSVKNTYISKSNKHLIVIDKENGGKADALNAGINAADNPYFCAIDADTLIDENSLINATAPFAFEHLTAAATGCNIRIVNGCEVDKGVVEKKALPSKTLEKFQVIEYLRAFLGGRIGWSYLNSLLIISGAFGIFKKKVAFKIGGYSTTKSRELNTVGEDMELVVAYHKFFKKLKKKYRVIFCHDANGWTEVPGDLKSLKKQRNRWQRGLIEVLLNNIFMFFNPKYGKAGMLAFPYFIIFEFLGPFLEVLGYIFVLLAFLIGILNLDIFIMLFVVAVLYGMFISILSIFLDEKYELQYSNKEILKLIIYAFIENLGYRQLGAFWRVGAYISLIFNKTGWGTIKRKGFKNQNSKEIKKTA